VDEIHWGHGLKALGPVVEISLLLAALQRAIFTGSGK
jgi:hypothetical protein